MLTDFVRNTRIFSLPVLCLLLGAAIAALPNLAAAQATAAEDFWFGQDLSYVNQIEDCGAVFRRSGLETDPFAVFAEEGTNLVRVRLWVEPGWWQQDLDQPEGVKPWYGDFEDAKLSLQRAQAHGMQTLLNFHYSDFWADPGRQLIPDAWLPVAHDVHALADSVFHYTQRTLTALYDANLLPDLVQVGNEINPGLLVHVREENGFRVAETVANFDNWQRHALLLNAAISAVRGMADITADGRSPRIALHWSGLSGLDWWVSNLTANGVTDFDIIGFSYYYAWHGGSIAALGSTVAQLRAAFPQYEVVALETGYLWSQDYGGIINLPDPEYLPVSPETQLSYLVDYARAVMDGGGKGVIFWEPAWVDTACVTPWQTGSSHIHVAFFDPYETNFMENGGGRWTNRSFYDDPVGLPDAASENPAPFSLSQNYPNPFNPVTNITFSLAEAADIRLEVFNLQGQRVAVLATGPYAAGTHHIGFDAAHLPSGLYLYRLEAGAGRLSLSLTRKMVLLK